MDLVEIHDLGLHASFTQIAFIETGNVADKVDFRHISGVVFSNLFNVKGENLGAVAQMLISYLA